MRSLINLYSNTTYSNHHHHLHQKQRPNSIVAQVRTNNNNNNTTSTLAANRPGTAHDTKNTPPASPLLQARFHSSVILPAIAASTSSSRTPSPLPLPPPPSPSPLRNIDSHNHNALSLTATRCTKPSAANTMPVGERGRQQSQLAAPTVPNKPVLGRAPLTPKVATSVKGLPLVTPLARIATAQGQKEDGLSPSIPFLGTNITPRSGPRQIRVESTNTTPSGTPNPERTSDSFENSSVITAATSSSNLNLNPRAALNMPALSYEGSRQISSSSDPSSDAADANKFFYASDAKPLPQAVPQRPVSVPQKPTTFFYANGISAETKRTNTPPVNNPFTPVLAPAQEPVATKFFYANGAPDILTRPGLPHSGPASTVSTTSRMGPTRPGTSSSTIGPIVMPQRPLSPIKTMSSQSAYTLKSSAMPMQQPTSPVRGQTPTLAQTSSTGSKRRVSIEAPMRTSRGHSRAGSVVALEPSTASRLSTGSSESTSSPPRSPGLSQPAMTMASILQAAEDLMEEEEARGGDPRSEVHSPAKSTRFTEPVSDLVANARRERKVQDLEITNASLEAINRTLERQLRKQTAELRRYRRLSRSGRLSLTPSAVSSRVSSLALTDVPSDLSDLDEEEERETEEEEEEFDSLDDTDSSDTEAGSIGSLLSPNNRIVSRRKRDEKRLQIDLTKHQELLVDSQKINQSLKRCLDWTEVLIKEGQKALEYHVRVSDVEYGGRVLAPADDDEDDASHLEDATLTSLDVGLEPPWSKGPQDRDSGIELPQDGSSSPIAPSTK